MFDDEEKNILKIKIILNCRDLGVESMAKTFYRLQRFLRKAQLLFLFLGVAYIMAGSVLLLQRSNVALFQKGAYLPSSLASIPLPPRSMEAPGVKRHHRRTRATVIQDVENDPDLSEGRAAREPFASRNLKIRHLRRHWLQGRGTDRESSAERNPSNRDAYRHKGTTRVMLTAVFILTCSQN